MTRFQHSLSLLAATSALAAAAVTSLDAHAQGAAVGLAPHRAVYEMSLDRARNGSSVTGLRGRMVYELSGSRCEGWTQTIRFVTEMTGSDGQLTLNDMRSSTFEDDAAREFRFNTTQQRDQRTTETTNGEARRDGTAVNVELRQPSRKNLKLEGRVYFPIEHSIALVAAARKGDTVLRADIYDASEKGEKVYETSSIIGARRAPGANAKLASATGADLLDGVASWPVTISYYERGAAGGDAAPVYELSFLYFENGVSRRIVIDYGEFAMKGEMREITFLTTKPCDRR